MRQAAGIAAGMDDQHPPQWITGERREDAQRGAAGADAWSRRIGQHQEAGILGQQAGLAPPLQLRAVHLGLALVARREHAQVPATPPASMQRGQVLLPVISVCLPDKGGVTVVIAGDVRYLGHGSLR